MSRRDDRNGRAAIVAILAFGAQLAAAGRAGDAERQAALPAELCLVAIILLASWTLHAWTFSRIGPFAAQDSCMARNGCSTGEYHATDGPVAFACKDISARFVNHFTNEVRPQIV